MLKVKAVERMLTVGQYAGQYRYMLQPEIYSTLSDKKVITEAAEKSGVARGVLQAAWDAIGQVIKTWATEGHSVAIPGLGTMRFGVNATSVNDVNDVATSLITSRKVIFTPNVDIKSELKATAVNITCYDRNGQIVKRVNSSNSTVDDGDGGDEPGGSGGTGSDSGSGSGGSTTYTVTLNCDSTQGSVSGGGTYQAGQVVTISATEKSGYSWRQWSDGVSTNPRTLTVTSDVTLTAEFGIDAE